MSTTRASRPVSTSGGWLRSPSPTIIVDSTASEERLDGWARAAAEALPNGVHRTLEGEWHGVAPEVLAPVMRDFYLADRPTIVRA